MPLVQRDTQDGTALLRASEGIDRPHVRSLWVEATRLLHDGTPSRLVVDLSEVKRIDVAGVALLREIEQQCQRHGIGFSTTNAAPAVSEFIEFVGGRSPARRREPAARSRARNAPFDARIPPP
jgi:anti-anti-sigma factor